jgi:superfamily I DNA/RNA helicase
MLHDDHDRVLYGPYSQPTKSGENPGRQSSDHRLRGSGKTQVISLRIIKLITSGCARPEQIIAFTYTEKAAAELKARILALALGRDRLPAVTGGYVRSVSHSALKPFIPFGDKTISRLSGKKSPDASILLVFHHTIHPGFGLSLLSFNTDSSFTKNQWIMIFCHY